LSAIVIANVSHLLAVLMLYQLALGLSQGRTNSKAIAFVTAVLHIVSPAGMFLSAPYGESTFALLNFTALALYQTALKAERATVRALALLLAGLGFGAASTVRGNGLLSGLIIFIDFMWLLWSIARTRKATAYDLGLACALVGSGLLVATGFIIPQAIAHRVYCQLPDPSDQREWCHRLPPSIYSWVQDHYWNVGFLRYWTLSNLPLFLLAAPTLVVLLYTSYICQAPFSTHKVSSKSKKPSKQSWLSQLASWSPFVRPSNPPADLQYQKDRTAATSHGIRQLAVLQAVLALLALTSFHVQIVTRISSGYPLWYFVLATWIVEGDANQQRWGKWATRWMITYATVQGVLFASFLPPA
jgi:GPI mannosyltransferase 2